MATKQKLPSSPTLESIQEVLNKGKKVLYMTHLALGDYVYQRQFLRQLKQQYPDVKLDIWIDDCRVRHKRWHTGRNKTLTQWLESESFVSRIYPIVANAAERQQLVEDAKKEDYDLVFFVALNRCERYAKIAKAIANDGLTIGTKATTLGNPFTRWWHFSKLDSFMHLRPTHEYSHISELYALCFKTCLGIEREHPQQLDSIEVPDEYQLAAKAILDDLACHQPSINLFINHLSTSSKRDYSWSKLRELLISLSQTPTKTCFVLNVPPVELASTQQKVVDDPELSRLRIRVFCADQHFLQLPALIEACDMVISVETAVMHLAEALGKKQIVLMRESAEQWRPRSASKVLLGENKVEQIEVQDIISAVKNSI